MSISKSSPPLGGGAIKGYKLSLMPFDCFDVIAAKTAFTYILTNNYY